ncbi:hypothetical protein [Frigoriglobus tundricola]|uniref:Uncharacterized protein n=1 Tax=Frigoriglobus tundricola TaxID=2774151 RepID=A0A6M5YZ11_9BACT|nr:hypothetical protein [Frigoriglobus tundricola]QJW98690.1 hypothetical protein FTUN_6285 [Frigoriglobus tundricola]
MTFNPLSGVTGSVSIGATAFAFTKWTLEMKCVVVKANNFTGGGYQQVVAGMVSASLTLEADTYDQGNMAFSVGETYDFVLGYTSEVNVTVHVLIESISPTVDYENGQPIKISGQSNGSFDAGIS